jgi:hypothetical protein
MGAGRALRIGQHTHRCITFSTHRRRREDHPVEASLRDVIGWR